MPRRVSADLRHRSADIARLKSELGSPTHEDDTTSTGHLMLRNERQHLYYLRLIEHEMPKLVAFRKPFIPPSSSSPVIIRSISYAGEQHPATAKRTIVASVAHLPLKDKDAIHKFKLLAGVRWTPDSPSDAGVGLEEHGEHGFIKIACEDFPEPAMNLKWASDTLDRLIKESNANGKDKFRNVPIDTRHVDAKVRKAKKGGHAYGRVHSRPTIKDFPKEWLPLEHSVSVPDGQ